MKKIMKAVLGAVFLVVFMSFQALAAEAIYNIKLVPSFGPPPHAGSFEGYTLGAVARIKDTGGLPTGDRSSVTDARIATWVAPEDLITSPDPLDFYRGNFNVASPWNSQRGGTIWWWIIVSANGSETVALSDLTVVLASFDPQNSLGKTTTFLNNSYTSTAIGVNADGSMVTSGSASQRVKRVIVGVGQKSYTAKTAADVTEIRNYIGQFGKNWGISCEVKVGGSSNSAILTGTPTQVVVVAKPKLSIVNVAGKATLVVENNGNASFYFIQSAAKVGGPYSDFMSVKAGDSVPLNSPGFFRYKP